MSGSVPVYLPSPVQLIGKTAPAAVRLNAPTLRLSPAQNTLPVVAAARPAAMDRGPGTPVPAPETPFESRGPGEVVVRVTIGGRGSYRFLVDTGSTHTAVTPVLAAEVGAVTVARTSMTASGGSLACLVVALPRVAIGPIAADGLTATALPAASVALLGAGLAGVLGQEGLEAFQESRLFVYRQGSSGPLDLFTIHGADQTEGLPGAAVESAGSAAP